MRSSKSCFHKSLSLKKEENPAKNQKMIQRCPKINEVGLYIARAVRAHTGIGLAHAALHVAFSPFAAKERVPTLDLGVLTRYPTVSHPPRRVLTLDLGVSTL
jgi:hypothetical protein